MKKLLAMVLALVMTLSLAVSANAAFKDADKVADSYEEAVAVLSGMGVFQGYEDGSFQPQGDITRAEVAAIVYRVYTADVKDAKASMYATYNKFSDMTGAGWASGYIGYCANAALVKGYPNGTFQPSGKVTGYEVLTMILRAIGYDKNNEFSGADWALHVAQTAERAGVLANVKGVDLNAPATRELVAELLFRAIAKAPMVTYTAAFGYQTVSFNGKKDDDKTFSENDTLGFKNFKLKSDDKTSDDFGRPTITWTYDCGDKKTVVDVDPIVSYTEPTKNCDLYADSGLKKNTELDVYTNSKTKDAKAYTVVDNKTEIDFTKQGRLTEVYEDRIVNIDTYLAVVDKAVAEKTDAKGHVDPAYVVIDEVYGFTGKYDAEFETDDEFKADDMVLVTIADKTIESVVKAESKTAALTKVAGNSKAINTIQSVKGLDKADATVNHTAVYAPTVTIKENGKDVAKVQMFLANTYNFYFDTYGNVIGADDLADNYAVLDNLYVQTVKGVDTAYATLYLLNGDKLADVEVDKIKGSDTFASTSKGNTSKYSEVYSYTEDDGVYTLTASDFTVSSEGGYVEGSKFMMAKVTDDQGRTQTKQFQLSKDTVVLLQTKESPNGTFKSFTGYEGVPSFTSTNIWFKVDSLGYVTELYAEATELNSRTVFVYDLEDVVSWTDDDKNTIATLKVKELDEKGELTDSTIDVYYSKNHVTANVDGYIDEIGLYEVVEGDNGIYRAYYEYEAKDVSVLTSDGNRVIFGGAYFSLEDAKVVKYTGSMTSGEVSEKYSAKDLSNDSWVYFQVDEKDDEKAVLVYDLYIEQSVTETKDSKDTVLDTVEYLHRDFDDITVALKPYECIKNAKMEGTSDTLTVTYYDKNGDEVTNLASGDVVKAVISCATPVTGDVSYTIQNQQAASSTELVAKEYKFTNQDQTATVSADNKDADHKINGTITVDLKQATVTAGNLSKLLEAEAKSNKFQSVVGVYNTYDDESSKVADTENLAGDMFVKVLAWDGETVGYYRIVVTNAATTA